MVVLSCILNKLCWNSERLTEAMRRIVRVQVKGETPESGTPARFSQNCRS